MMQPDENLAVIYWQVNGFRGDKFEDAWRPAARAVLDYGATSWMLFRSQDDPLSFIQMASFPTKTDFDRYWFSEEIAEARAAVSGYFQLPVIPKWLRVVDAGELSRIES
jgi:hypothetical protein